MTEWTKPGSTQLDRTRLDEMLDGIYAYLGGENNVSVGANYKNLAKQAGIVEGSVLRLLSDLERCDVLRRSYRREPGDPKVGKTSRWVLTVPQAEGRRRLLHLFETTPATPPRKSNPLPPTPPAPKALQADAVINEDASEPPAVTVRQENGETVEAIVGPDKPHPFESLRSERKSDSEALVAAARQYRDRKAIIERAFLEMEKQGITIEWDRINETVHVEFDQRLDDIAQILPHITNLEKRVDRLAADNAELRERLKGFDTLRVERDRLRAQNQRLLAERVGQQAANQA